MMRHLLSLLVLLPGLSTAATFTPTRFDDPAPNGCPPADCSLREAVLAANATPAADQITLPAGTFQITYDVNSPVPLGETGPLVITAPLSIVGAGRTATTITSASTLPLLLAIGLGGPTIEATIADLAFANVVLTAGPFGLLTVGDTSSLVVERVDIRGNAGTISGIFAAGALTVRDALFAQNTGTEGTVYALGGQVSITGTEFRDNDGAYGALAVQSSDALPLGDVVLTDNVFRRNLATAGGGALTIGVGSGFNRVDLRDSVFEDNRTADKGGALQFRYDNDAPSTTRLEVLADGTLFAGNTADGSCGALSLEALTDVPMLQPPSLTMDLARFENNDAGGSGGALCTVAATTITRSTFAGNTADAGAGAILAGGPGLVLQRSTVSGNTAGAAAGGILALTTLTLEHSTVHGNAAGTSVGGLVVMGATQSLIRHSTITGNTLNGAPSSIRAATTPQLPGGVRLSRSIVQGACTSSGAGAFAANSSYSIESPGDTCSLPNTVGTFNQRNVSGAALALGLLTDNGGTTLTRMPGDASVARNPGVSDGTPCTTLDQREYVSTDTRCDVGAVEVAGIPGVPLADEVFADGFE